MPWCDTCSRGFSLNGYQNHISTSAAHRSFTCRFCNLSFTSASAKSQHETYDNYNCEYCDRVFCSSKLVFQHRKNDNHECNYCTLSFCSEEGRDQHYKNAVDHPYCVPCDRWFQNMNNLLMHQHSKVHNVGSVNCPFCRKPSATASGLVIHLESGTCSSGLDRQKINSEIRRLDSNNIITRPMLTMPGYESILISATERSWNGVAFECYLCPREFSKLAHLNQHLKSPAHEQKLYRCPNRQCEGEYKTLSGLVQHIESESCGVIRFGRLQQEAKKGITNMVGRMITE